WIPHASRITTRYSGVIYVITNLNIPGSLTSAPRCSCFQASSGFITHMKITTSTSPTTTRPKVPAQKSHSSTMPCSSHRMFTLPNTKMMTPTIPATTSPLTPNSSLMNAVIGVDSATDEVIPAMKSSPNHLALSTAPIGSCWNTAGIVANTMLYDPEFAIAVAPDTPKKTTAAGIAMDPPSTTSATSLVDAVATPESRMSSLVER